MLAVAVVTAIVWYVIDYSRVFEITLALLVITCPCALALATPAALSAAACSSSKMPFVVSAISSIPAIADSRAQAPAFALLFACIGRGPYFFGGEDRDPWLAPAGGASRT